MRPSITYQHLQTDIAELLRQARNVAVRSVNAVMTSSYWEVGRRIAEAEQKGKRRVAYGRQLIKLLAMDLTAEFGRGFSEVNLKQIPRFYLTWPAQRIRQTLSAEFGSSSANKVQPQAQYALEGLSNKVLPAHYQTLLPSAEQLSQELRMASVKLAQRGQI